MRIIARPLPLALVLIAVFLVTAAVAESPDEKRTKIDAMADEALRELFAANAGAKDLHGQAYGHAVFDNLKIAFGISGGGGSGVAVSTAGERTYMKMGTGGIGFGLGGQKYQVIFLFQNESTFRSFVDEGWQAGAAAQAAAGDAGANAGAAFQNGVAIYQMTKEGLMASADISGTKYWKHDDLNE